MLGARSPQPRGSSSPAPLRRAALDPAPPAIRPRLRRETADLHEALERRLDLLGPGLSRARYRRVLEVLHGFHGPLEAGLRELVPLAPPLGFALPAWTARLARDLEALGMAPPQIARLPRCAQLPRLHRMEDLAGCLYVLEGAALGGHVVGREVERRLGLRRSSGAAFFAGEGEPAPRWRRVVAWLERVAGAGADADAIVAAARETFAALGRWVAEREGAR